VPPVQLNVPRTTFCSGACFSDSQLKTTWSPTGSCPAQNPWDWPTPLVKSAKPEQCQVIRSRTPLPTLNPFSSRASNSRSFPVVVALTVPKAANVPLSVPYSICADAGLTTKRTSAAARPNQTARRKSGMPTRFMSASSRALESALAALTFYLLNNHQGGHQRCFELAELAGNARPRAAR
jgi:hypothetical protein